MKRIWTYIVLAAGLLGCTDGRPLYDAGALSDQPIVIASSVGDPTESKATIENETALTGIRFLRKDGLTAPADFSSAAVFAGDRATNGNITFTPTVPTYRLDNQKAYFRAYYPSGTVSGQTVKWSVDGKTDILVGSVFDAGSFTAPLTGGGGANGSPMIFSHQLAQLEVTCAADPSATVAEALVQFVWGKVTKVELIETPTELTFDYATGVATGSVAGAVALSKTDYTTAFPASDLTKAGVTAAAMLVPAASGVAPLKLRVTTEKGGVQTLEVQLKSGETPMGFEGGRKHAVRLQFNATEKQILVSGTKITDWATGYSASPEVEIP